MLRAKKKIDHALEAALPGIYLPLYTMVTFTRIPYAKAAKRAQIQDAFVYAGPLRNCSDLGCGNILVSRDLRQVLNSTFGKSATTSVSEEAVDVLYQDGELVG